MKGSPTVRSALLQGGVMKAKAMKNGLLKAAGCVLLATGTALAAPPLVSNVNLTQTAGSRFVTISYTLDADAIITLSVETNGVPLPPDAISPLSGDACKAVQAGNRVMTWDAGTDWPSNLTETAQARVKAWHPGYPPPVMVLDLSAGSGGDAVYPVFYYDSVEALPFGGLTNQIYRSERLVMRKIKRGGFLMGRLLSQTRSMILSQDFYAGVFEVTQGQWHKVTGDDPGFYTVERDGRPVERVSYNDIRGSTADVPSIDWPNTGYQVSPGSFLGRLRSRSGLTKVDLPTEVQWEYMCRAGTRSIFNCGSPDATKVGTYGTAHNPWLEKNARYNYNDGISRPRTADALPSVAGTAIVGSYLPNAWGLYDTLGNVMEWVLDYWPGSDVFPASGVDPTGPTTGSSRIRRSGGVSDAQYVTTEFRFSESPGSASNNNLGFRIVKIID
jgi:formylglycine-generating enzyme required for sulfatase activity